MAGRQTSTEINDTGWLWFKSSFAKPHEPKRGETSERLKHLNAGGGRQPAPLQGNKSLQPGVLLEDASVKITAIETLRTEEFANVLWVRVHTDAGHRRPRRDVLRCRRGRGAYPRHAGGAPARPRSAAHRGDPSRDAQPADGAVLHRASNIGRPRRSTSRCGTSSARSATSRCTRCSAGCVATSCASTTPAPATAMSARTNIKPVSNWNLGETEGPYEDLDGFMNRADALGREPAGKRHHGDEDLAVRSAGAGERRSLHLGRADEEGDRAVRKDPQGGRRQDGDHGRVPFAVEPADREEDRARRSSPMRRPGTRIRSG